MKIKEATTLDNIVYILACVFTLGGVYIYRVIWSHAIRKAMKE